MFQTICRPLWADQSGGIITAEMTLVMTILVLGLVGGLQSLRSATTRELENIAGQLGSVGQQSMSGPSSAPVYPSESDNLFVGGRFDIPVRGGQFRAVYDGPVDAAPQQCVITAESDYWARAAR